MKKRFIGFLALALLASMCLGATAYAEPPVGDQPYYINEPPLPATPSSCPVNATVSVAGRTGNRYYPGDMVVLTASIENQSTEDVSGMLTLSYPEDIGTVVAGPALACDEGSGNGDWRSTVKGLAPGARAEIVVVLRAPDECAVADWDATAGFFIENGGGACAVAAEGHFGDPCLKADKSALLKDGMLKIRNVGNGGASRVKFRFLAKKAWQNGDGLPDNAEYVGEGRIEVEVGGIVPGGKVEKDLSGLLHQRMDPAGELEVVYESDLDGPLEYAEWEDGPVE